MALIGSHEGGRAPHWGSLMATKADDVVRAFGLIRRIEDYRAAKPVAQDDAAARVMSAIVAYARATRRDAKKAKGGR